jgi:peptidoglycan/xylan/chitin deacetylase (PgdA/CDA1 family)
VTGSVVLTGDVHQWIDSGDRRHAVESETALGLEYARIAERHGLKTTLFLTGRSIRDHPKESAELVRLENVEIGGHGWDSFRPTSWYRKIERLFGTPHGPGALQRALVSRTCRTLEATTGVRVTSWRNHAYRHDSRTPAALRRAGIRVWSDEVDLSRTAPYYHDSGLIVLPMNTTPDHESVYHGDQTPDSVPASRGVLLDADQWLDTVARQVDAAVAAGGVATILAHPLCMRVLDRWQTFERLCTHLERYPSAWAREASPDRKSEPIDPSGDATAG